MAKVIVVGVDESERSRCAVEWAVDLATDLGASVRAVHVASSSVLWQFAAMQYDADRYLDDVRHLLDRWTKALHDAGVPYKTQLVQGDPAIELLQIADAVDAYAIVVGSRKHPTLHDLIIGGTAHKLVNRARRPVVLVPPPAAA